MIVCDRCGRDVSEINLVDSPYRNDERLYCLDCYAELFPPGWTEDMIPEYQDDPDDTNLSWPPLED